MRMVHRRLLDVARAVVGDVEPSPATPEQIEAAQKRLGRPLPPGYRAFLQEVGRVTWPLVIGNIVDFEEGPWPPHFVPFADDLGGNLYGFDLRGKKGKELPIDYWDHEEPELEDEPGPPERFEDWLKSRVDDEEARTAAEAAPVAAADDPSPPTEDEDLVLARQLLGRLQETGQLETEPRFSTDAAAEQIADAWSSPARILAILMDRGDVIEVYASEEELAALLADISETKGG